MAQMSTTRRHFLENLGSFGALAATSNAWNDNAAAYSAAKSAGGDPPPRGDYAEGKVPLIHCTDLFHPPGDPDDHVDLATVFALPPFDVRAIILDQGQMQAATPGR